MTKKFIKKIIISILLLLILNNFILNSMFDCALISYADPINDSPVQSQEDNSPGLISSGFKVCLDIINGLLGGVIGILTWPFKLVAVVCGMAFDKLIGAVAYIESNNNGAPGGGIFENSITPFDILFNTDTNNDNVRRINLLNINFFNMNLTNKDSLIYKFRLSIAMWYYVLRNLASVILMVILIYVGIRMALSNVTPDKKAKYKKMLVDWTTSVAIIFIMQYIMLFVININNTLVDAIYNLAKANENSDMRESLDQLCSLALKLNTESIAATIVYCMLVFQTFALFISYFKRMLTLAFLTIISPLITLTYSIDKMGDGKAQALNTWLKEYVFTILLQPFHCIIYIVFVKVSIDMLNSHAFSGATDGIAAGIIAILCMNFIREAEKIVRKIFAFGDNGKSGGLDAGFALAAVMANKSKNIGKTTAKGFNTVRNFGSGVVNGVETAKVEAIALSRYLSSDKSDSYSSIKSQVVTERSNEKADKLERKKYAVVTDSFSIMDKKVQEEANKLIADGTEEDRDKAIQKAREAVLGEDLKKKMDEFQINNEGMSDREAYARARLDQARENKKKKSITGAVGRTTSKISNFARKSETVKALTGAIKTQASLGFGMFVGSGIYGSTGDISKAILSGAAGYGSAKEFMKGTALSLKGDIIDRLKSLGINGGIDTASALNKFLSMPGKYAIEDDNANDFVRDIINKLTKALEGIAGSDAEGVTRDLEAHIKKQVLESPDLSIGQIVDGAIDATSKRYGLNKDDFYFPKNEEVMNQLNDLTKFKQEQAIFIDMKDGADAGISLERLIKSVTNSYTYSADVESDKKIEEFIPSIEDNTVGDKINEYFEDKNDATRNDFVERVERENLHAKGEIADAYKEHRVEEVEEFEEREKQTRIISKVAQDSAVKLSEAEIRKALEDIRVQVTDDLNEVVKQELRSELDKLSKKIKMSIKMANLYAANRSESDRKLKSDLLARDELNGYAIKFKTQSKEINSLLDQINKS